MLLALKRFCIRVIKFSAAVFLLLLAAAVSVFASEDVQRSFKAQMPNLEIDTVGKTGIPGLYEVVSGNNILYYHPKTGYIIFGEIWSKDGVSLTEKRREEIMARKVKDISKHFSKAVKVGKGSNVIVEFTNPDCPFCRKAFTYFEGRKDVTEYIFFLGAVNPKARNKILYVLCSKDREGAYKEVMSGRLDGKELDVCSGNEAEGMIDSHTAIAKSVGVTATPTFIINGRVVVGANIPLIEDLLSERR